MCVFRRVPPIDPNPNPNPNPSYYAYCTKEYLDSGFTAFEGVIVFHILLVAVTVGLDLTYERHNPSQEFIVSNETLDELL